MGAAWAFPCGEREKKSFPVNIDVDEIGTGYESRGPERQENPVFQYSEAWVEKTETLVQKVRRTGLNKFLRSGGHNDTRNAHVWNQIYKKDLHPFCVVTHPNEYDHALVVFRPRRKIFTYKPDGQEFSVHSFGLSGNNRISWR